MLFLSGADRRVLPVSLGPVCSVSDFNAYGAGKQGRIPVSGKIGNTWVLRCFIYRPGLIKG
jgi:hypothetical protein